MISIIFVLTLLSLSVPIYVYLGYPLILLLLTRVLKVKRLHQQLDQTPNVTLLVSCYNEADVIREKIENCLELDYPLERLEIIFVSDGSNDGTDDIVRQFFSKNVRLVRQEGRLGKTMALNMAISQVSNEYIVFSDANAMYAPDALKKMLRNFVDPDIGYVVGAALYTDGSECAAAQSEDTYWQYELFIKKMESDLYSVVGGDGAIYAIRRELYQPLQRTDINDFVNPLQIVAKGYRGIFEAEARCYEETAGNFNKEAKRKQRIVNRSFNGLMKVKTVMNPFKFGTFSFEVISHKLLRWLIPVFLLISVIGSVLMACGEHYAFQLLLLAELIFFWLAFIGYLKSQSKKISAIFFYPYYFVIVNVYSLFGVWKALLGDIQITWSSHRSDQNNHLSGGSKKAFLFTLLLISSLYFYIDIFRYW